MKLTAVFITCLSLGAYAQDYVVTTKNDTLRGEVKPLFYDRLDRVQVTQNKKRTNLTAIQVRVYFYKGETYRPMKFDNAIRFMKVKIDGYLSLYLYRPENQTRFEGLFLSRRDGSSTEVPNLTFKKGIAAFLSDAPALSERVRDGSLGRNDLDQIVHEYNAFIDANTQAFQKAVVVTQKGTEKFDVLEALRKTVQAQPDFANKKDALDLMNDLGPKLKSGETIPNYLLDTLKGFLANVPAAKPDLDAFLETLKR